MKFVCPFDREGESHVSLVGGKGVNLIRLAAAGFRVPPGFVVTADAYSCFIQSFDWMEKAIDEFDYANVDQLRQQCEAMQSKLKQQSLPTPVVETMREVLLQLGAGEDDPFAVRSSSTLEDLAQAAFAGQHDTYLNVRGTEMLCEKVRNCFVSLWGDRAVRYRHQQGFSQKQARMAVVVQRQINCDRAGVGFSINPVTGNLDRMILNANFGIGESVVSGEGEIDQFELDKTSLQVIQRHVGHKESMVAATASGVEERAVPKDRRDEPCLDDAEIRATGELLRKVEAHYGWPQDIEWGWHKELLYLFQSRAVTTIQPRYTRDESAERFPNPMTPLTWDFICEVFRRSLRHSLELMGLPPLKDDWFSLHDYYVYGNQNAVELLSRYRPLRSQTLEELVAEIPQLRVRYAWVSELPIHWAHDLDRYLICLGRLSAKSLDDMQVEELWRHVLDVQQVASDYFLPNIAISITQTFLHRLLLQLVGMVVGPDRALRIFDSLMAGCEFKTAAVNLELHEIARLAAANNQLKQELTDLGGYAWWEGGRMQDFPEFAQRFERFIQDHGHREMDMDYYHPTWSGQPWVVLDSISLMLRSPLETVPREVSRQQRIKCAEAELDFFSVVPEELRFFFHELVRLARAYTALDDLEHYETTRVNPVAREAGFVLGRRLVEAGILDEPGDLFFLRRDELAELVGLFPRVDAGMYRQKVEQAKSAYESAGRAAPPWSLDTSTPAAVSEDEHTLAGLPGSPGKVSGSCFLVRTPSDFGRFPPGSIIVARTTNPAWTPLFYSASGLITESGGPLSHGAVTAREMQLPAVMSVRGVMSRLRDGQVVTVDGSQGAVLIEE